MIILGLCKGSDGPIVKGKSMATEEIHLNAALIEAGHEVVETDLGEFVVQLDGDTPSHIVTPIIHRTRQDVAETFRSAGISQGAEDPAELAMQARVYLREKFKSAAIGISGVNFAIAETGRLVIVENEGNNRLSTTAPKIHIAVMGVEKLLPSEADLALFLPLLAGSATGQQLTVYSHFITGPRPVDEPDGPDEVHLVLLDCGRRKILESKFKEILKCIRCGACLNVCPVYRQVSGHGYRHVYPGPIGAVLAPLLDEAFLDLPYASTLCGACNDVCPVKIPISDLLVLHRSKSPPNTGFRDSGFKASATNPQIWKRARKLAALAMANTEWAEFHILPSRQQDFRGWWRSRGPSPLRRAPGVEMGVAPSGVPDLAPSIDPLQALGITVIEAKTIEEGIAKLPVNLSAICDDDLANFVSNRVDDVWGADVGIAMADALIVESGTLILSAGPGKLRKTSLCPPVHVAVVYRRNLIQSLAEGITSLGSRSSVLITGPSRTADIEGVLVRGVHGPGEVIVILVEG